MCGHGSETTLLKRWISAFPQCPKLLRESHATSCERSVESVPGQLFDVPPVARHAAMPSSLSCVTSGEWRIYNYFAICFSSPSCRAPMNFGALHRGCDTCRSSRTWCSTTLPRLAYCCAFVHCRRLTSRSATPRHVRRSSPSSLPLQKKAPEWRHSRPTRPAWHSCSRHASTARQHRQPRQQDAVPTSTAHAGRLQ